MQLGTRWAFGAALPAAVPTGAAEHVAAIEAERASVLPQTVTSTWRWTLTFLEGRARLELEDGTLLVIEPNGSVAEPELDDDDSW